MLGKNYVKIAFAPRNFSRSYLSIAKTAVKLKKAEDWRRNLRSIKAKEQAA